MKTTNKNLVHNIFAFLNIKELSTLGVVSKRLSQCARQFNWKWREECNEYFFTGGKQYDMMNTKYFDELYQDQFELEVNDKQVSWRGLMLQGMQNRKLFHNYHSENFPMIDDDIRQIENLTHEHLKRIFSLPKLRKENIIVENDINTTHQLYTLDSISEQREIYEYYDKFFKRKNNNTQDKNIIVRRDDIPLGELISNISDLYISMINDENQKKNFLSLRWYEIPSDMEDLSRNNPIIFLLRNLHRKFFLFCQMSYNYINKYNPQGFLELFCNEYIKRYQSFCEAAIFLDDIMENFNVSVNYIYDALFPNQNQNENSKFSIYRMMMNIWNREVTLKLLNEEDSENNLYSVIGKVFKMYLESQLEEKEDTNRDRNIYAGLRDRMKYFSEMIVSSILDIESNEFTVYLLNHTQLKTSEYYNTVEQVLCETMTRMITEKLKLAKIEVSRIISFLIKLIEGNLDTVRFINRTRIALIKATLTPLLEDIFATTQVNLTDKDMLFKEVKVKKASVIKEGLELYYNELERLEDKSKRVRKQASKYGIRLSLKDEDGEEDQDQDEDEDVIKMSYFKEKTTLIAMIYQTYIEMNGDYQIARNYLQVSTSSEVSDNLNIEVVNG